MFRVPEVLGGMTRFLPVGATAEKWPPLRHRALSVDGRLCTYGEVLGRGDDGKPGPTVVLVHGWGLSHSSYKRAAQALGCCGYRVLVPDLPGFGWSADLPMAKVNFAAFAGSLRGFLLKVQAQNPGADIAPAHIVGHSFGGAVSLQFTHDQPDMVRSLVLVDAASGATWSRNDTSERPLAQRPLWDWAIHLAGEFPRREFPSAATAVIRDLGHNLIWHLPSLGLVANITRRSDLRKELRAISARGTPVSVVWGASDTVVTRACCEDQCSAAGCEGTVVRGNHGWLLEDPNRFGRVIADLIAEGAAAVPAAVPASVPAAVAGAPAAAALKTLSPAS
jgi:pimeloyl-ACP methyl ester carboxylesterase